MQYNSQNAHESVLHFRSLILKYTTYKFEQIFHKRILGKQGTIQAIGDCKMVTVNGDG